MATALTGINSGYIINNDDPTDSTISLTDKGGANNVGSPSYQNIQTSELQFGESVSMYKHVSGKPR